MNKNILRGLNLAVFLLLPLFSHAQINANSGSGIICQNPRSTMLWEVVGSDVDGLSQVYLFGSLHVGKADFYPLPDIVESTFLQADHLVFEVDPASIKSPTIVSQIQAQGMLPAGQSLPEFISAEVLANLDRVIMSLGLPRDDFMKMQPWLLTLVLSTLQVSSLGYSSEFGIESYLLGQKESTTDVLELETIQDQLALLQGLNSESYLSYALLGFDENGLEQLESLIRAWQCADKETLATLLFDDSTLEISLSPEDRAQIDLFEEKLFFERNLSMAAGIEGYLKKGRGKYFVVVGSGHLVGERSIIDVLRGQGYQINPIVIP